MGGSEEIPSGQMRLLDLKARCPHISRVQRWCDTNAELVGEFHQVDTYYRVNRGRLKIREVVGKRAATLIYYSREDLPTPKRSKVYLLRLEEGAGLNRVLGEALGVLVVVEKRRAIYRWGPVQIHIDRVDQLGDFIEFERTIGGPEEERNAQEEYDALRKELHIPDGDLVSGSYSDLLLLEGR